MNRVGNSDVWYQADTVLNVAAIQMPVPPSTNERQTIGYRKIKGNKAGFAYSGTKAVLIKTQEALSYEQNVPFIRMAMKYLDIDPFSDYTTFNFFFTLKNPRYDTHNGLKIVCDVLEKAGVVLNDRFILPHIHRPDFSDVYPKLIITFPR